MGRRPKVNETSKRKSPPARNPENRENQLIDLAYDLVEDRLRNGTASAQETVHFLKLGTAKSQLEKKKLEAETMLLEARKKAVDSSELNAIKYEEALAAFRVYNGSSPEEDDGFD